MIDYELVHNFKGYTTKPEETNTLAEFLVSGSQNVLINDGEKVESRNGFTLDGDANAAATPIESSYDWFMFNGNERNLRSYDDELEYRYVADDDTVTWRKLADSFTSVAFNFAEWWDTSTATDKLLFVNGTSNMFEWSGGITTMASATANTITKNGTTLWGEEGFTATGSVVINGTAYAYTGGFGTTTLTGVTPSPAAEAADSIVHQQIVTNANSTITDLPNTFENAVISTLKNQVYVGSYKSREIYVSKGTDYKDFSFSATRTVGEGAILTLGGTIVGLIPDEKEMFITASKDQWYATKFTLADNLTSETLEIERLKTASQQAAQSQNLISKIKNAIIYVSNEPTLDELTRNNDVPVPQSKPISDPIKPDFDDATFTNGDVIYYKNQIFISAPNDTKVYIYDINKGYWQPPQILPVRVFSIIGGELYGHSSVKPETYKLFVDDIYSDNEARIEMIAKFAYRSHGKRANLKEFDYYFTEGYITTDTILTLKVDYDYKGFSGSREQDIDGNNEDIIFTSSDDVSLGKEALGKIPLGSSIDDISSRSKFRDEFDTSTLDHYEYQVTYSTSSENAQFEIIAHGPNIRLSKTGNQFIRS